MASPTPAPLWLRLLAAALVLLLPAACGRRAPPPAQADALQCLAALDRAGVQYQLAPAAASAGGCAVLNPVSVAAAAIPWNQPAVTSCALALALARFERETVEPAALLHPGQRVRVLRHRGAYACRGTAGGRTSQHAAGNAIDIAGFELEDGTLVLVERDWRRRDRRGDFLRDVARRACREFSMVLTPDSDPDHRDHLHLDIGPWRQCGA
jgi:hypothetical protein